MRVPTLVNCCCVFALKTGTAVLGGVIAVMSLIMLVTLLMTETLFSDMQIKDEGDPDAEAKATGLYVITLILIVMYTTKCLSDVVFVYGVCTENRNIIKKYSVVWFIFFLLSSFLFFLHVSDFHAFTICFTLLYIGLNIYAALLAYNLYEQINSREEL